MATINSNGDVVCTGTPNCTTCDDLLCMQTFNGSSWTYLCPDCLETYEITDPMEWVQDPGASGAPTQSYPNGAVPSGGVALDCGDKSKLVHHKFTKTLSYSIVNQGWPWAQGVMQGWSGEERRQRENGWAAQNVPNATLEEFALAAFNDAKAKKIDDKITCGECPSNDEEDEAPECEEIIPCPRVIVRGTVRASNMSGANARMGRTTDGGIDTMHVVITLTGTMKLYVHCNEEGCEECPAPD